MRGGGAAEERRSEGETGRDGERREIREPETWRQKVRLERERDRVRGREIV